VADVEVAVGVGQGGSDEQAAWGGHGKWRHSGMDRSGYRDLSH
jgi:hypothetical protein